MALREFFLHFGSIFTLRRGDEVFKDRKQVILRVGSPYEELTRDKKPTNFDTQVFFAATLTIDKTTGKFLIPAGQVGTGGIKNIGEILPETLTCQEIENALILGGKKSGVPNNLTRQHIKHLKQYSLQPGRFLREE